MDYTIYAVFTEQDPNKLWQALALMPDWYSGLLMTVFGFCFGSAPLKKAGGALAQTWRTRKVKLAEARGEIPELNLDAKK
jgi:hypothetical protein